MAQVTFKSTPVQTAGDLPQVGQAAPGLSLVGADLSPVTLADFAGKKVILNIFPSIDTPVCAAQTRQFSQRFAGKDDVVLLFASLDLPFALSRFCAAEGIENAVVASDFRDHSLAEAYGVLLTDSPLQGLYARASLVLDAEHKVVYSELVAEIAEEPDYEAAVTAFEALS